MSTTGAKVGQGLAAALGIKLRNNEPYQDEVTRGESILSVQTADTFVETRPTTKEFFQELVPSGKDVATYTRSLFPFLDWIGKYNLQWLLGDLVAGITIGAVVVPQGMAYAILADLEPQFGLYSSFMGVLIYWFFATSKDITIGPVAVMSTLVGGIVIEMKEKFPEVPGHVVASALSIITGAIVLFLGLTRTGFIVDLISLTSLSAFMTGSAISIVIGQIPTMMGISGVSTRDASYLVLINTLKNLKTTKLDAAMGLSALAMLYIIRSACSFGAKKWPEKQKLYFFLGTLRTVFVILLYTMISWLVNMNHRSDPKFKILKDIPGGFQNAAVPVVETRVIGAMASNLPAAVIVLLIEHIAISKSFGRVNNYSINPSQEMVAIGVTNLLAPFLGGYPSTGSFSRTAIKSKAGVRTPFAGVITAVVVLLAIYVLPPVFFYIPSASLAAVIIHAVGDLITPPNTLYQFWCVSPLEVLIFFIGVIITVFSTIENGIYATVAISAAILLGRILKARGRFLGPVRVHSVLDDRIIGDDHREYGTFGQTGTGTGGASTRNIFLPIDHGDGSNPDVEVESPYPGVFIYRFTEGFSYPNASHTLEYLTRYVFAHTRRTNLTQYARPGDRPWNDPGPSKRELKRAQRSGGNLHIAGENPDLPTLKAIILDFSSVNHVDVSSVQQLIDVRNQLDRYAAPDPVDWHIACIGNRWTKRALVAGGFGYPTPRDEGSHRWKSIFSVAEIGGSDSAAAVAEKEEEQERRHAAASDADDLEKGVNVAPVHKATDGTETPRTEASSTETERAAAASGAGLKGLRPAARAVTVHGLNRPLFHVDLTSALQSAIANIEARRGGDGL
ncbi:hypothetical protein MCOR20_006566 [Pyricularia oryzae]|nr:hypothetical protein MCOR20_006566 [Pyricularia oryzae]